MKNIFALGFALLSSTAFAQLPEFPADMAVADLEPNRTTLSVGTRFETGTYSAESIRCEVTAVTESDRNHFEGQPFGISRIDSAEDGAVVHILASPFATPTLQLEFACERTPANGQAGAFTIADFKSLFPGQGRRTGFFKLPRR